MFGKAMMMFRFITLFLCWLLLPAMMCLVGWQTADMALAGDPVCIMPGLFTLLLGVLSYIAGVRMFLFPRSWRGPLNRLDVSLFGFDNE